MSSTRPTNSEVIQSFENWRRHLLDAGFAQSFNVYYRLGNYDLGPVITKTAEDIKLVKVEQLNGKRYWTLGFNFTDEEYRWNTCGKEWRLYDAKLAVEAHAFFTNGEAYEWFSTQAPR